MDIILSANDELADHPIEPSPLFEIKRRSIRAAQYGPRYETIHIVTDAGGEQAAQITLNGKTRVVTFDYCLLGPGRDDWMRQIEFRCAKCQRWTPAGMFSDVAGLCSECV